MATVELRTVSGPAIRTLLEIVKDLATRISVRFDNDGMHCAFMDHAHVAMTSFSLRPVALQHYACTKPITVGVDANSWYRYLKSTAQNDVLTLTLTGQKPDIMVIRLENKEKQYISKAEMRLTSLDQDDLEVPDVEYSNAVAMGSRDFLRICREMGAIPGMESLCIGLDSQDDGLVLSGDCDMGNIRYEIASRSSTGEELGQQPDDAEEEQEQRGEQGMRILRAKGSYREVFGLRYLLTFAKAAQLCSNLTIYLEPQLPVLLCYEFMQDSELRFHLAPRTEDPEFEDEDMEDGG